MKERSLLGFAVSLAFLSIGSLTIPHFATAAPAPIFRPILRDIQNQLPRGMVMRLPASLELTGINGRIKIYPILEPPGRDYFRISLASEPNCQARYCGLGYIAASQPSSDYSDFVESLGDERYRHTARITLRKRISGTYVYAYTGGASSGLFGVVFWEQDGLTFVLSLPFTPYLTLAQNKQKIIDIAISMANELPIRSTR